MIEKKLVDEWLNTLSANISKKSRWALFEPRKEFYEKLETGEDEDLWVAETELCSHMELDTRPSITY